ELGVMSISAELAPDKVDAALEGIAESVTRLALIGPTPEELERARTLTRARWARRLESMEGRAASLAGAEGLDGYEFLAGEYAALATVDPDQVRAVAAKHLHPDSVSAVLYLPRQEADDLTTERLARAFAVTPLHNGKAPAATRPEAPPP